MDRKQFRLSGDGGRNKGRRNHFKNAGFIALLILFALVVLAAFKQPTQLRDVPFSQVISDANHGRISQIVVSGDELLVTPKGAHAATEKTFKESGSSIYEQGLQQGKVSLTNKPQSNSGNIWVGLL